MILFKAFYTLHSFSEYPFKDFRFTAKNHCKVKLIEVTAMEPNVERKAKAPASVLILFKGNM